MDEIKSKVYIKLDSQNRIIRCEGGYTIGNIDNVDDWILIDEGDGDKYNLCQSHYFEKPLFEDHGVPVYKFEKGLAVERSQAEIDADIVEPTYQPTDIEILNSKVDFLAMVSGIDFEEV